MTAHPHPNGRLTGFRLSTEELRQRSSAAKTGPADEPRQRRGRLVQTRPRRAKRPDRTDRMWPNPQR